MQKRRLKNLVLTTPEFVLWIQNHTNRTFQKTLLSVMFVMQSFQIIFGGVMFVIHGTVRINLLKNKLL